MPDSVLIRAATQADTPGVSRVYLASRHRFLPYAPLAHSDDAVRQWIATTVIPSGGVCVAVVAGEIVGMMALSDDGAVR
jgi:hypothetical protein